MKWAVCGLAAVFLMNPWIVAGQASPGAPTSEPRTVLAVRTYNAFGVAPDDVRMARAEAATILGEAGIRVVWVDCWFRNHAPADAPAGCAQPLGGTDVVLRLQSATTSERPTFAKFASMGFSLVGSSGERAYLSSVFPVVVQSVARGAAVDERRLLGWAIAHEIGHLLLNTPEHSTAGLMRADWSRKELQRNVPADWRFLETEAATMRAALSARETSPTFLLAGGRD
jgi:hypothetical protein